MNSVIESLLELVAVDPLPSRHASSHWAQHGRETVVQLPGNQLVTKVSGFESIVISTPISLDCLLCPMDQESLVVDCHL